jgi:hypothetical protein
MSHFIPDPIRLVILGLLVLAILAAALLIPVGFLPWRVASASPGNVNALTPAQQSAIQGAEQLLLLPGEFHWSYLPMLRR